MSYADARLDLTGVPVACLSGQNGAGKSALLDAVTWALWEEARSTSDELIRLGEKEMWVDLVYTHEDQTYRVRRSRQRSAARGGARTTSKGTLELQVLNQGFALDQSQTQQLVASTVSRSEPGDSATQAERAAGSAPGSFDLSSPAADEKSWRSLTSGSMRDTQKTINELLRMDFDTFVNSAYLRQGKADEFTTRPPIERKQVLAEILGLSYFDRLQERCKERAKSVKSRAELLEMTLADVGQIETQLAAAQQERALIERESELHQSQMGECQGRFDQLNNDYHEVLLARQKNEAGRGELERLHSDVEVLGLQHKDVLQQLEQLNTLIGQSPAIEKAHAEFSRLKALVEKSDKQAFKYQELSEERLELKSQLANMRAALEVDLDHVKEALGRLTSEKKRLQSELCDEEKVNTAYGEYRLLVEQETDLSKRHEAFTQLTQRTNELKAQVAESKIRLETQLEQMGQTVKELSDLLKSKASVESQRAGIESEGVKLDKLEAEFERVEEKGLTLKGDLETLRLKIEELKRRQVENLAKVSELIEHQHSSICPLCSSPIVDRAAVVMRYQDENEEMERQIKGLEVQCVAMEEERLELRQRYMEIKKSLDGRKDLDTQIGKFNEKIEAIARAEEQLEKARKAEELVMTQLDKQDYAQLERESLISVKAELHKLDFDPVLYANVQSQLRARRHIESRFQKLKRDKEELARAEAELPSVSQKVNALSDQLTAETYGQEVRAKLHLVQSELTGLGYERDEHLKLKRQLEELLPAIDRFRDLRKALEERPQLQEREASCRGLLDAKKEQASRLEQELKDLAQALERADRLKSELDQAKAALVELQAQKEELAKKLAVVNASHEQIVAKLAQLDEQRNELKRIQQEQEDYVLLAEAFGKKGIQAIIIENAIPEIEEEANRILSRLTDNKMHIGLVTQHKTKSGGLVETLDLLIGDEIGTRNYELYSGGEAFKVNFAVRVALSKLLARRSGAKLETLIIDEGFGSQDDASRDKLVNAIRSIQNDFARILVITHIQDIREMFPTQIQVVKENGCSRIRLAF